MHALRTCDHAPEDRTVGGEPARPNPPLCGGSQRADGAYPIFQQQCPPCPPQRAWTSSISYPDSAACLYQWCVSRTELLELTHPAFWTAFDCPGYQFARLNGYPARGGACRICHRREPHRCEFGGVVGFHYSARGQIWRDDHVLLYKHISLRGC